MSESEYPSVTSLNEHHVFGSYIWSNPGICNNCFARMKDIAVPWKEQYRPSIRPALAEEHYIAEDGERGHDVQHQDDYGAKADYRSRVTCSRCGSVGGRAETDELSISEAVNRVPRLVKRLEEEGFDVREDRLKESVIRAKSKEKLQGYDREIFGIATRVAITR